MLEPVGENRLLGPMTQQENHLDSTQALVSGDAIKAKFQVHVSTEILLFGEGAGSGVQAIPQLFQGLS
ncbi:hypothetical protein [Variovorax sp. HW608]|uniref:hypothetical protein n=1 Tax=Variovorax sp. HW608 TaxID=1034889 RepID=UPI0012FD75E8|nr:hypothetical protein [Variovorax sp. HW608]